MNLQSTWQNGQTSDSMLSNLLEASQLENLHSILPLAKLKRNILVGIAIGVLITAGYIAGLFLVALWQVNIALVAAILFNAWIIWKSWRLYRMLIVTTTLPLAVKQELQKNIDSFHQWWKLQQRASLFVYPIVITGGFILGGVSESNKTVSSFLLHPWVLSVLILTLLVLVPLCYFLSKWMFNYSYKKHLKKLEQLLEELS